MDTYVTLCITLALVNVANSINYSSIDFDKITAHAKDTHEVSVYLHNSLQTKDLSASIKGMKGIINNLPEHYISLVTAGMVIFKKITSPEPTEPPGVEELRMVLTQMHSKLGQIADSARQFVYQLKDRKLSRRLSEKGNDLTALLESYHKVLNDRNSRTYDQFKISCKAHKITERHVRLESEVVSYPPVNGTSDKEQYTLFAQAVLGFYYESNVLMAHCNAGNYQTMADGEMRRESHVDGTILRKSMNTVVDRIQQDMEKLPKATLH